MSLLGAGVLAIWNGIADGRDDAFLEWHIKEHIPERIGVPGFLRGRRYKALEGDPAYFNFYEVHTPQVLLSPAYLARLNDPTPWTRKVVATFTDTSRTICRVACSAGAGVGAYVDVLRFDDHDSQRHDSMAALVTLLPKQRGIVGAHLLCSEQGPPIETLETRLRKRPDLVWAAVLIVEAATVEAVTSLRQAELASASVKGAGFAEPKARGLYQLQFCLDRTASEARPLKDGNDPA